MSDAQGDARQTTEPALPGSCPTPFADTDRILMGHGGGGKLTADLVRGVFLPNFDNPYLAALADAAVVPMEQQRLAFAADAFVVQPLFFPGGNIGDLAVHGTINDLAMCGAMPLYLSATFVIEEGFPIRQLEAIAASMGRAARDAGVLIVTGDTKVVERGRAEGCYISTSGIGLVRPGVNLAPTRIQPGDRVLVSGTLADHGMAVMSVRAGLEFDAPILSDTAPLHGLVNDMLKSGADIRMLRDPTRGGLAASLLEISQQSGYGMEILESSLPMAPAVAAACELLGLDPLYVANEGKLVAIVRAADAELVLSVMKKHPHGASAATIGEVTRDPAGTLAVRTSLGARRRVAMPRGEQLPRIC